MFLYLQKTSKLHGFSWKWDDQKILMKSLKKTKEDMTKIDKCVAKKFEPLEVNVFCLRFQCPKILLHLIAFQ